jgi:hypothetical protein
MSCAQIDNNQQVYEAQIQMPRCNSILKVGSHECQKIRPLHIDRCTGEHTDHNPKATHLNVCMLLSVWARSCFWIGVSTLNLCFIYLLVIIYLCTTHGKIYLEHHHWYYSHDILFFWIADYLWWRYLKFLLSILKLFGWGQHDSLPPASSKHHSLNTPCPCKQAFTHTQCYRQGYW